MKLQPSHDPWSRLVAAARRAQDATSRDTTAPYGFATRVAALAAGADERRSSLFERFALRAVTIACAVALSTVVLNYRELNQSPAQMPTITLLDESTLSEKDPVAVVLDLAD